MKKVIVLSLPLLLIMSFFACSTDRGMTTQNFILEKENEIGVKEGNDKDMFGSIYDIEVDELGNIYVLDSVSSKVKKYNKYGNYVLEFGNSGQGPGEFGFPEAMVLDSSSNIYILDSPEVKIFDENGKYKSSFKSSFVPINITISRKEKIILLGSRKEKIFHIFDLEGNHISSFGALFDIPSEFSKVKGMSLFRSPINAWASEDNIYVMNPYKYEILVFKDEKLEKRITKEDSNIIKPKFDEKILGGFAGTVANNLIHRIEKYLFVFYNGENANWMDIYESEELITSIEVDGTLKAVDRRGKFYFVEDEDFFKLVIYKMKWD